MRSRGGADMRIVWLGQAGFYLECDGIKILIDPYLSESCKELNPNNYRRMPIDSSFLDIRPDVIVLTHGHLDHTDPETLKHYLSRNGEVTVLASPGAYEKVRGMGCGHNYVRFSRHSEWTVGEVRFVAVKAEHSDAEAIGVIIEAEGKKYYHTGDTLYNTEIFDDVPDDIYAMMAVVNGKGNNMNMTDAQRFAERVSPKYLVPMHWGLHDELYPDSLHYEKTVIPEIYKEIRLEG